MFFLNEYELGPTFVSSKTFFPYQEGIIGLDHIGIYGLHLKGSKCLTQMVFVFNCKAHIAFLCLVRGHPKDFG